MAPALTEPISPTEKLNSSVSTTTTTATRSTRKLETATSIKANNNNNLIKQTPQLREKRNCNNNNSITVVQAPTSSIRLTRSRDTQQQRNLSSPNCKEQPAAPKKSPFKISSSDNKNNEQMGLSTAVLDNKNKLISENTATTELADTNRVEKASQEDTSTAQLLADLTNEAITADICLRNQLKDVNLVKVSEGSASPLQRESEIVVIKAIAASPNTSIDTAHMETQCNESESNTATPIQDSLKTKYEQPLETDTLETTQKEDKSKSKDLESSLSLPTIAQQKPTDDDIAQDEGTQTDEKHQHIVQCPDSINVEMEKATTFTAAEEEASLCPQESASASSPDVDAEIKKEERDTSKPEIISVQELPPVNTDSTMTASEVEDNLEGAYEIVFVHTFIRPLYSNSSLL